MRMHVVADPSSIIEIYAEVVANVTFHLVGFWAPSVG